MTSNRHVNRTMRQYAQERAAYIQRLDNIPVETLSWFAGWLCADGSILNAGGGRPKIRFVITDIDPLDTFSVLFGNAVDGPHPPRGLGNKPVYAWAMSGWRAALLLDMVRPWLSVRYTARLDALGPFPEKKHCGWKLTPVQVNDIRNRLSVGKHGVGKELAREYNVTDGLISAIKTGRIWPDDYVWSDV